ncbi:exonuclease SbcCD, D subunit [Enterococcus faecalis 13-SD-W-01]|nr:exonuclease SbcCD, D subunit [Enterococcus faecalis 13-SD-W-01]
MRFLHTADWHIGKKIQGYDILEDQKKVISDILAIAKEEQADAIVIAGDLYDRSVPSVDAVELFNQQMIHWNLEEKFPILAISGNHDSSIRLSAGAPWFAYTKYHLHTQLSQAFTPIEFEDTQFFLLPYFEPIAARIYFEDETIRTIQQAMPRVVEKMQEAFDKNKKQVLVSHFFVAGSPKTDSETKIEIGGLDAVPSEVLAPFTYTALGHLHNPKALQQENARYSGSPLKFSLSEIDQKKGVWIVDTTEELILDFRELAPLYDMIELTAEFRQLLDPDFYQKIDRESYIQINLTDRTIIPNMMNQLRAIYPRILGVERTSGRQQITKKRENLRIEEPHIMAERFFQEITEEELTAAQKQQINDTLQEIMETE